MRILLVEDNRRVREVVTTALQTAGHSVASALDCAHALACFTTAEFDVAIVDIGLPDGSGIELCRKVRRAGLEVPILLLTARTDVEHRIKGLDAGADDYLGKPFAVGELTARVRALGRRGPRFTESVQTFGSLVIDRDRRLLTLDNVALALTPREFEIVALLAFRNGRAVARDEILETVWGEVHEKVAASLDVLVGRIRRKLGGSPMNIRTVRQVGYAWALEASKAR